MYIFGNVTVKVGFLTSHLNVLNPKILNSTQLCTDLEEMLECDSLIELVGFLGEWKKGSYKQIMNKT